MNSYIVVDSRGYYEDISCIFPFVIKANDLDEAEKIFDKMKVVPDHEEEALTHESGVRFLEMTEVTSDMYKK